MQVDQATRREVGSLFHGARTMYITTPFSDLAAVVDDLRTTIRTIGRSVPFATLIVNLTDARWADLEAVLPLVLLLRREMHAQNVTLLSHGSTQSPVTRALQRAVGVAVQARGQGWDNARLMQEVRRWAEEERQTEGARASRQ